MKGTATMALTSTASTGMGTTMKGTTRMASTRMAVLAVVSTPMTDAITTNSTNCDIYFCVKIETLYYISIYDSI
jgi:hypothetical protein